MKQELLFSLSLDEKYFLIKIALLSILNRFAKEAGTAEKELPVPQSATLCQELGAFVTLKKHGVLRGCIGYIAGDGPLYKTVSRMAQAAAFEDPRFPPLEYAELEAIEMDISVMGPISPCETPELVEVGRHGLIIRRGGHSGLLLPQVPMEWGWDKEMFLDQTCRKAGLPEGAWHDAHTQIFWFEAVVFSSAEFVANKDADGME